MGVIGTALSMSLDGFIAGQDGGAGGLHDWLTAGDIPSRYPACHWSSLPTGCLDRCPQATRLTRS